MVGIDSEIGKKKGFPARLIASAVRFQGYKDSIDLRQRLGIVQFQNPAFLGSVVLIEDAKIQRLLPIRTATPPRLKCLGPLRFLLI